MMKANHLFIWLYSFKSSLYFIKTTKSSYCYKRNITNFVKHINFIPLTIYKKYIPMNNNIEVNTHIIDIKISNN